MTRSAGSSPRATARRRERDAPTPIGTVPFALVEVLTPRTLAEALRLRAEHQDAWPIQGGTDVMVALNFDRGRPACLLNLNEVHELRGFTRENGALRLGSGLTYSRARARPPARRAAGARGGLAHGRLAADPQPRHDRRQSRHVVARRRRAAAAARRGRRGRVRVGARHSPRAARRVRHRREAQRARAGRADHRRLGDAVARAADVHEDRPAQRDGDRGRLARRLGGRRAARVVRLGVAAPGARDGAARRGRLVRRARRGGRLADRRRARQRALPPPRAARAHRARAEAGALWLA